MNKPIPTLYQFVNRELNAEVVDTHGESQRILLLVDESIRDEYLRQAILSTISKVQGRRRRDAFAEAQRGDTDSEKATNSTAQPGPTLPPSRLQPRQNTARQDAKRGWWGNLMSQVTSVPGTAGRKLIGELTAVDIEIAITYLENQARYSVERAEQYRTLLKLMENDGVSTVAEITKPERLDASLFLKP